MKSSDASPPGWLIRLLERILPEGRREFLIGDLEEEFFELLSQRGRRVARRWFLVQTCRCLVQERCRRVESGLVTAQLREMLNFSGWRADLGEAFRRLNRQRGFCATIVLTLALGIAVNTSMFTLLNGLLLRPLPQSTIPLPVPAGLFHSW